MSTLKWIFVMLTMCAATLAQALEIQPYSASTLAAAQQADKPVAVHFRADWCPTCRAQDKALQELRKEPGLDLTVLEANYDTEKELKRKFGVQAQSTLVVLHGRKEVTRLVGDTSTDGIRRALKAAF
ncbi:MAG: thioredoxin family protein [Ralstonia sp.]|jgi:thioredoxin 1|uniref:Thioredoxin domain-containing protein n=2 Tax=Ralstonia TaxID=48736 RepID=A0ABM9JI76_9RALS|nr:MULTISPECIES: thioredoxin family protein [Ralstonia]MBA9845281.1 thioredoxin [Ralstonia pickettii]MBA9852327.1 thioredoxin [Ralstonia pickettii]MBA9878701.1 thioredoxin [Ralstonia pickettii]MBA9881934.1 thioredoxin [Ralstonia pickettii]MBA9888777.1 thioredoxin [Ralstonia pickettii]